MQSTAPLETLHSPQTKPFEELDSAVIRFCGDSGDGMQLVGTQFTNVSAAFGNDVGPMHASLLIREKGCAKTHVFQ